MKWVIPVLLVAASTLAVGTVHAWTQSVQFGQPVQYDHAAITHHSDDPHLDAMVGQALNDWGRYGNVRDGGYGMDIRIRYGGDVLDQIGKPETTNASAASGLYHIGQEIGCDIVVREGRDRYAVILHEVGHCLGLEHTDIPGNIMDGARWGKLGADDIAGIRAIYPYPHRSVLPVVAHD